MIELDEIGGQIVASSGPRPPKHFVIATLDRCGGRMLQTALDAHPEVTCLDEIFSDRRYPGTGGNDPVKHLHKQLTVKPCCRVQGFRFLPFQPEQVDDEERARIRTAIVELPAFHVIFLCRNNSLRQAASRRIAAVTHQWRLGPTQERRRATISIPPLDLWREFARQTAGYYLLRHCFSGYPSMTVSYEALSSAFELTLSHVLDFLGVESIAVKPSTRIQNPEPLTSLIENFEELKAAFADTPFAGHFDE